MITPEQEPFIFHTAREAREFLTSITYVGESWGIRPALRHYLAHKYGFPLSRVHFLQAENARADTVPVRGFKTTHSQEATDPDFPNPTLNL